MMMSCADETYAGGIWTRKTVRMPHGFRVTVLAMTGLLLLRPTKRGTDERGSTSEFHSDDPLDLGQQLLVGDGSSTLEIGDLARQLRESLQKTPSWGQAGRKVHDSEGSRDRRQRQAARCESICSRYIPAKTPRLGGSGLGEGFANAAG
jgi:hypothetical protein